MLTLSIENQLIMGYIKGKDRYQRVLFPDCIDDYVESDAPVRLFDAFVDSLDMDKLNFVRSTPSIMGTPSYDPRDLLKLYIYGYFYEIRSSRKLGRACKCNIEIMWLISKLTPDFRTISDFRKDNKKALTQVYKEFNKFCLNLKLFSKSYIAIDGSKFKAVNAKDNNFTLNKLDDRIKRLDEHIALYMEELDAMDNEESRKLSKDELQHKLNVCQERKQRYEGYRNTLEETGESQISLTDPDARLMKQNEGFCVGYNVQTAVDADSHLIAGFQVTNSPTDHGMITEVAQEVKSDFGTDTLEVTADKGYECPEDHQEALTCGIVPNVIQRAGGCTEVVEFEYKEASITDTQKNSTRPEDIRICLEAGVIPAVYNGILSDTKIMERKEHLVTFVDSDVLTMSPEQMRVKAMDGYFVRDAARNLVYCPQGEILRQKSEKRNGNIRYCNKLACKKCKCKCTSSKFKEADFSKDTLIKPLRSKIKTDAPSERQSKLESKKERVVKTIVRYILHLDQKKMNNRKCLSEHPFGTIKRSLGQYYFLTKGFAKVEAEMGLFCLSYNMRRVINMKGVPFLLQALQA
jgi:transposase